MTERLKVELDELSREQLAQLLLMTDEFLDAINSTNNELLRRLHELPELSDEVRAILNEWSSVMNSMTTALNENVTKIADVPGHNAPPPSLN